MDLGGVVSGHKGGQARWGQRFTALGEMGLVVKTTFVFKSMIKIPQREI